MAGKTRVLDKLLIRTGPACGADKDRVKKRSDIVCRVYKKKPLVSYRFLDAGF